MAKRTLAQDLGKGFEMLGTGIFGHPSKYPIVTGFEHLRNSLKDPTPQYGSQPGPGFGKPVGSSSKVATAGASAKSVAPVATDPVTEAVSVWAIPSGFDIEGFRKDVMSSLPKDAKPEAIKSAVDAALKDQGFKKSWTGSSNATGVSQAISPAVMQMYMAGLHQNMGDIKNQFAGSSDASMQKMNDAYKAMDVTPSPTTNALNLERANLGQNMAQNAMLINENVPFVNQFLQSLNQNNSLIQQLVREQQYAAAKNNVLPGGQIPGVSIAGLNPGFNVSGT